LKVKVFTPPPVKVPVQPGDRLSTRFPVGRPLAVLVWADWSRPSVLEKRLLEEATASGSLFTGRVQVVLLDMNSAEDQVRIDALGGAPSLPALYLVSRDGVVRRRFIGWPARNPSGLRTVLKRELTALVSR
jgi:hypothetical protein